MRITIEFDVPEGHRWASGVGSLVVADDGSELVVTSDAPGHFVLAHWQNDEPLTREIS